MTFTPLAPTAARTPTAPAPAPPDELLIPDVTLVGHAATFGTWTQINSVMEGRFMERVQRGAFRDSLLADAMDPGGSQIRLLMNHGRDSMTPIGKFTRLEEDNIGLLYEAQLFDTSEVRALIPPLATNSLGASFRFSPQVEEVDPRPGRSAHNKRGLPERTLVQVALAECGPCTFGAYTTATAGIRYGNLRMFLSAAQAAGHGRPLLR